MFNMRAFMNGSRAWGRGWQGRVPEGSRWTPGDGRPQWANGNNTGETGNQDNHQGLRAALAGNMHKWRGGQGPRGF